MTKDEWLNIINKIDDEFIDELANDQLHRNQVNEKKSPRKEVVLMPQYFRPDSSFKSGTPFKKVIIAVAAVVCVVAVGIFIRVKNKPDIVSPNDSTGASSGNISLETSGLPVPENLILGLDLPENTPSELSALKLTLKKWDKEEMENLLLDGKEIEEKSERECDFYPNEMHYSYDTKDQFRVYFEPGRFCIDDKAALGGEFKYGSVDSYGQYDYMASDEELSAFSREDAVKRVNKVLDELGIENYGEPKISPITAEFANTVLASIKEHNDNIGGEFDYTPWTAEDEIYILRYPLVYELAELSDDSLMIPQKLWGVDGSYIDAVVTKDKIIRIYGSDIYDENYEVTNKIPVNYDSAQALEKLKEFYSNLALDTPIKYYKCKLVYMPSDVTDDFMTVSYTPAWQFYGYSESEEGKYQQKQYFYADTGYRYIEN